ncbi:MAG: NUDIX hydrolase [Dehalococcoidia bacterium]
MDERVLESRRVYDGRILNLRVDRVALTDGHEARREIVEHDHAVAVVPVTDRGEIVMVRQYRLPAEALLLEVPAGMIDPGEDPEAAAQRELREETGYAATRLRRLCGFWVAPGYCTEYIHVYLAEGLHESRLDHNDDERIEVETVTLSDALHLIDTGSIEDAKSICGLLQYARIAEGG